jgi:hypothetical protein
MGIGLDLYKITEAADDFEILKKVIVINHCSAMILFTGYFPQRFQVQSRSFNLEFMVDRMVVG